MLQERWLGDDFLEDATGARIPLLITTIDRVDSDKGYEAGNARLLLYGWNILNRDKNDREIHEMRFLLEGER